MRKALIVTIAVLLGMFAPATVRAEPAGHARAAGGSASAVQRLHRALSNEDLTVRRMLRLQRGVLAATMPEGGSGLLVPRRSRAAEGGAPFADPLAATDLDGDGTDEAIVFVQPRTYTCTCLLGFAVDAAFPGRVSVRGAGGGERWGVDTGNFAGLQIGDLTRDGVADLVLLEHRFTGGGGGFGASGLIFHIRSIVRVIDGTDGSVAWTRSFDGIFTVDAAVLVAGAVVVAFANVVTGVQVLPDADGDAAPDLLVRTIDWGNVYGVAVVASASLFPHTETGHLLHGIDGSGAARTTARGGVVSACVLVCAHGGQLAMVRAMNDVSGDGLSDVLTVEVYGRSPFLSARGWDGEVHWVRSLEVGIVYPQVVRLNGDTADDVLVLSDGRAEALDGRSGVTLWEQIDAYIALDGEIGDVDGDGGNELLARRSDEGYETVVVAVSGSTGEPVWTHHVLPEQGVEENPFPQHPHMDVTGDGVKDPLIIIERTDEETGAVDVAEMLLDGKTGATQWLAGPYQSYAHLPVIGSADVNGSGSLDLVRLWGSTVELFDGSDLTPLGTATLSIDEEAETSATGIIGADLDGDGKDALVLGVAWWRYRDEETVSGRSVHALEPGAQLWMI